MGANAREGGAIWDVGVDDLFDGRNSFEGEDVGKMGANIFTDGPEHFETVPCPHTGLLHRHLAFGHKGLRGDRRFKKGETILEISKISEDMKPKGSKGRGEGSEREIQSFDRVR